MLVDNRQTPRALTSLPCTFGMTNDEATRNGTVTSLSAKGCFVKTKSMVNEGRTMQINLFVTDERFLTLMGTVVYHFNDIGFGMLFTEITTEEQQTLEDLTKSALQSNP